MPTYIFQYEMLPTTWFYLSALIILAVLFKFNRFFSVRNLDVVTLILMTPGLLLMSMNETHLGYCWLFGFGVLVLVRLFFDTVMVRRPLLESNLSQGGLGLACVALLGFMLASMIVNRGETIDDIRTLRLEQIQSLEKLDSHNPPRSMAKTVPGYPPFLAFTEVSSKVLAPNDTLLPQMQEHIEKLEKRKLEAKNNSGSKPLNPVVTEENGTDSEFVPDIPPAHLQPTIDDFTLESSLEQEKEKISGGVVFVSLFCVFLTHIFIVLGIIQICHCHFDNFRAGLAASVLYLLLPYTSQMMGRLDHFVPAALMLWAIAFYRRPILAGVLIGLAGGLVFYPLFLVPLWVSFYWKRGWVRFLSTVGITVFAMGVLLLLSPTEYFGGYWTQLISMFGWNRLMNANPTGIWAFHASEYRYPLFAAFLVVSFGLVLWPARKHLATLLSCSAIVMVAVQFWMPNEGGLYIGWYLPILILTIFRPNLEDRIAQTTVVSFK